MRGHVHARSPKGGELMMRDTLEIGDAAVRRPRYEATTAFRPEEDETA